MSRSNEAAAAPYHHGDLRNALLNSARALANEVGADKLTLREVARHTGVSHAAAYHHFADKNDLLRQLAIHAFGDLTASLQGRIAEGGTTAGVLEQLAADYLSFARERQAEFRFMFRRDLCLPEGQPDALKDTSLASQAVVTELIRTKQALGDLAAGDADLLALSYWSIIHGFTMVVLETPAFKGLPVEAANELARQNVRNLLAGIGA